MSINVQRGRDHGLPGYNAYRKLFGLPSIESMDQRPVEIEDDTWNAFKSIYLKLVLFKLSEIPDSLA